MKCSDGSVGGWVLQEGEELEVGGYEGTEEQEQGWTSI